ncbi:MAG TPA: flagellar motor switch protein FliN [Dermatophilaceae bacterium]
MTPQALLIDLDTLLAAAGAAASHLSGLGELDVRALGPAEKSGHPLGGGVALSVRIGGVNAGVVGLLAGVDAAAAMAGAGEVLEAWGPVMAEVVAALTSRSGDLEAQGVEVVDPRAGDGPALEQDAISVGLLLGDRLLVAIGFVPEREAVLASPVFAPLVETDSAASEVRRMHLLRDVQMGVSVELGRTRMTVRELLALAPGAIVELDKAAGGPVDVLVNGTLMARGEVVVIDEEFAVRISEIVAPQQDRRHGAKKRFGA